MFGRQPFEGAVVIYVLNNLEHLERVVGMLEVSIGKLSGLCNGLKALPIGRCGPCHTDQWGLFEWQPLKYAVWYIFELKMLCIVTTKLNAYKFYM